MYVALLRSFHPEGRELIRRALDTLVPVLPARLLPEDLYKVVKWTKKILVDDGYSMPQMCHIWHMIIRFSDVFYSYRSQLVPQMLNAVTRIGLSGNAASEFRLVAVAIADLVITWEIKKPDKVPEYTTGGLPSSLITPPLPTIRKRLLSEEAAPIAPRGRHTSDTNESRPAAAAAAAAAEDSGERAVKRSRIEEKFPDKSSDNPPVVGAAGAHYLSKKIDIEPMSTQMTLSGVAGASAAATLSDSTGTGSSSKMKMESGQVQLPGIGEEKQLNKSLLQIQRGSGTATLSTQPMTSGPEREGADESYTLPRALVQVLANFVMRLCIFATDNKDAVVAKLSSRCLRLFEKMSALPAMRSVPLPYYERLLQNALDGFNQSTAPAVLPVDPSGATTGVTGPGPGPGPIPPVAADKPLSKPTALGAAGGSSSRSIPQGISDTMLCNLLDIASSSLTCAGGPNKLFEQNAYHLKELHAPVFASETPKVHESYKKFLRTVSHHIMSSDYHFISPAIPLHCNLQP